MGHIPASRVFTLRSSPERTGKGLLKSPLEKRHSDYGLVEKHDDALKGRVIFS
jgi:hypothetical protein